MSPTLAVIPIALAILAGWTSRRLGLVKEDQWPGIEALSFRVLIPAILIASIANADLSPDRVGPLAIALIVALLILGAAVLALRAFVTRDRLTNPSLSTIFQVATRYNAIVSLAAADLVGGPEAVLLVAVTMAVLVPVINVGNIVVLAALCSGSTSPARIAGVIVKNPLILGCALGLLANAFGGLPHVLNEAVSIVGRAALGVGLLVVGAGLSADRFVRVTPNILLSLIARPLLAPALFLGIGMIAGLSELELIAGVLVTAVPAATNGYVVAKSMGGDADLYADALGWQTILSLAAIPGFLYVAGALAV